MGKCVICEQRRGKRFCPLKNAMICSQCCGLLQAEGNCPGDCPFLVESKTFASEKQGERENQLGERFKRDFSTDDEKAMQTVDSVATPLNNLFLAAAKDDSYLEDKDLVEALDDLIAELKGGVGEVKSPEDVKLNRAGNLVPQMKDKIESLDADPPVADYLVVPTLEILRGLVSLSMNEENPKAYIDELIKEREKEETEQPKDEEEVAQAGKPVSVDVSQVEAGPEAAATAAPPEEPTASDLFEEAAEEPEEK